LHLSQSLCTAIVLLSWTTLSAQPAATAAWRDGSFHLNTARIVSARSEQSLPKAVT
jgi:hypothetical protein